MKLTIGGKEYTFKFSVEASLNDECIEKTTDLIYKIGNTKSVADIQNMIHTISNVPTVALSVFYAGLLEYHGMGRDADHSIRSKDDAKELIKVYLEENAGDAKANFYEILTMMIEQMGEDGFFALIGLDQIFSQQEEKKPRKRKSAEITAQ